MSLPRPGASRIQNLVATMLANDNSAHTLNLVRIAHCQGFDVVELADEFARQETPLSLKPRNFETPESE